MQDVLARCPARAVRDLLACIEAQFIAPDGYVPDPYYDGAEGFENVLTLLEDALSSLLSDWSTP